MAASALILNRLKVWICKKRLLIRSKSFRFKTRTFLRLAIIPISNEQNHPFFLKFANSILQKYVWLNPQFTTLNYAKKAESDDTKENKPIEDGTSPKSKDDPISKESLPSVLEANKIPAVGDGDKDEDNIDDDDSDETYIRLMEFPEIVWPGLMRLLKNLATIHLIIQVRIDSEFNPREFLEGAKQAITRVSNILAEGKLEDLKGLVADEAIATIQPNLHRMSYRQRQRLEMKSNDMYVGFIDDVKVIDSTPNKTYVEITCCFHALRDLIEFKRSHPSTSFANIMEHKERISIGNYRFVRDYSVGNKNHEWVITKLNHFQPFDIPDLL